MPSGPMPSPPRTAIWSALLADMEEDSLREGLSFQGNAKHRARNLEISGWSLRTIPEMTEQLRRQNRAPDQPARLQTGERVIGTGKRLRRHLNRRFFFRAHKIEQFPRLAQIADIAALNGNRLDRDQREGPGRAAT